MNAPKIFGMPFNDGDLARIKFIRGFCAGAAGFTIRNGKVYVVFATQSTKRAAK